MKTEPNNFSISLEFEVYVCLGYTAYTTWYEQMGRKWEQNETHIYTHTHIAQNYQLNKSFLST